MEKMDAASATEEPNTCILPFVQQEPPKMVAKGQKKRFCCRYVLTHITVLLFFFCLFADLECPWV